MPRPRSDRPYVCGPYKHRAKWRCIVYVRRDDGTRERELHSFDSREKAAHFKRTYGIFTAAQGRTVGDAVTEYVAHLERKGNKPGSIKTSRYRLDAILDTARALVDLTATRAQGYYDDLVDEGGAVDTQRGCLVAAKAFGRFCHDKGWLKLNPFAGVEPVGRKSRGKEQLRIDEGRTYTARCCAEWVEHGDRTAIAALLPLLLNLRASEVAQLVARDVDDGGALLWVGEADSKTLAGRRRVRTPAMLRPALLELAAKPATVDGHLFATERGEPADRHWVSRHARRLMALAKVKVVTTHGLRGTHATFATVDGDTSDSVARSMGHTDPGMTQRHYIDQEAAAGAQVDRAAVTFGSGVTTRKG